jgi:ribonucleoside-diphosphate reductase alpha chain
MSQRQIVKRDRNTIEFYDPKKLEAYIRRYTPENTDTRIKVADEVTNEVDGKLVVVKEAEYKTISETIDEIVAAVSEYIELEDHVTTPMIQEELFSIVDGLNSTLQPHWQDVAGAIKMDSFRKEVYANRGFETGLQKVLELGEEGQQYTDFYKKYSDEEIALLESFINEDKDYKLNHVGAVIAYDRYTTSNPVYEEVNGEKIVTGVEKIETYQERLMAVSMFNHQNEINDRIERVIEGYIKLSNSKFLTATPTFMNSGRPSGNLSSCFVGMVDDTIDDIYREADQFAKVSKNAGGYGLYFGKVRTHGSSIRNKPGLSSGSVPFMKLFDVTAGTVDQQGKRPGAITITQDVFNRDLPDFLKTPLNNTTLEKQMHKIYLAVSFPDIFYKRLMDEEDWYQFDPKEVSDVMGFNLEDCYDETKEGGTFTNRYEECIQAYKDGRLKLVNVTDPLTVLSEVNRTRIEKGHPFIFNRDIVNRDNPNKGMIYCSNLCTEIAITMSLPTVEKKIVEIDGEEVIVEIMTPGDTPTCNLSSMNLSHIAKVRMAGEDWKAEIADIVETQYRMLANVIGLNDHTEMEQTKISSKRKREVGLGIMGLSHALAISHLAPDSEAAIDWMDEVHEEIAYNTVKQSMLRAKELNDVAPAFYESKWADGSYIDQKFIPHSRDKERWEELREDIKQHGMFSTVLMATAPTETISYIANTTAGADPVFNLEYTLEKAKMKTNLVVQGLNAIPEGGIDPTRLFYKDAFTIDKEMFLKGVGVRQRWTDQSISTNLYYIKDDLEAFDLVQDYVTAWDEDVKTIYYHRSQSKKAYELACEMCAG